MTNITVTVQDGSLVVCGSVSQLSNSELIGMMTAHGASVVVLCSSDGDVLGAFSLVALKEIYD